MCFKTQEEHLRNGCVNLCSRAYENRDILTAQREYTGLFLCKELDNSRIFNNEERKGKGTIFMVDTKNTVDFFDMQLFTDAEISLYQG